MSPFPAANRPEMQRDLQALEQRWGLALQSAGFGVWDLDIQRQTVHYSPQWKAMLGYADDDAADSTTIWRERVHPDDLQPMLEVLGRHLRGETPGYEREFRLLGADGRWRRVLSRGRVVERDAAGMALRAVGTLTDLTDRREAERLRAERDRAEAASRAKSEFLSRMSHELRTPLNAVLGFAQLLASRIGEAPADEQRRQVQQIETAGWQLLQLIDDVLDLARLQQDQLDFGHEPVELAAAASAALHALAPVAREHGVQLALDAAPEKATVRADARRLHQVLSNLIGNAIKYNRAGGRVRASVSPTADGWALAVSDTGPGIPAAQVPHLFEPFNRLGRTGAGGVGIGLALAQSLVEHMGGALTVQSTEGSGSTFTVLLPRA